MVFVINETFGVDLSKWLSQPREVNRRALDILKENELVPIDPNAAPAVREEVPELPQPTEKLKTNKDGLPLTSPVVGKHPGEDEGPEHIERDEWRSGPKFIKLHRIAEAFRSTVVHHKLWECPGYNCHDCVEAEENIDQVASCHAYFTKESGGTFAFTFPAGAAEFADDKASYVKKHQE
jgi:hypothetical protein